MKPFQKKINVLKERAEAVEQASNSSHKQGQNSLTQTIALLQQALVEYNSALETLQSKSDELNNYVDAVKKEMKNLGTRVEDLEKLFPKK